MSSRIFTSAFSCRSIFSAKPESARTGRSARRSCEIRGGSPGLRIVAMPPQRFVRPDRQNLQVPQNTREARDHVIAGPHVADLLAHLFHDAGRLVAEHARRRHRQRALEHVQIAVADAAGARAHEHLARPGARELDVLDRERGLVRAHHGGLHVHLLDESRVDARASQYSRVDTAGRTVRTCLLSIAGTLLLYAVSHAAEPGQASGRRRRRTPRFALSAERSGS